MGVLATTTNVRQGIRLIADDGFICLTAGAICEVQCDEADALYVACRLGRHYLDGQLDDGDVYIGFRLVGNRGHGRSGAAGMTGPAK